MHTYPRIAAFAVLLATTALVNAQTGASPATQADVDRAVLHDLRVHYEEAIKQADPSLLGPYLDPQFSGVMITSDAVGNLQAMKDYWAHMQSLMGQGGKYSTVVHVEEPVIIGADVAMGHGTTDDTVTTSEGREYKFTSRWTGVAHKEGGQWKIVRIHSSMDPIGNPFVMAAMQKATLWSAVIAGVIGLVVGVVLHLIWSAMRRSGHPKPA